jgi:glycerophosphoryl diester phosphodiesterase
MSQLKWLTERPIAHRGFHDGNDKIWENTLSAFQRAIDAGFAIECDLQYAADGVPVVFHDFNLERLCGIPGDVRSKTSGELKLLAIGKTADKIPLLKDLLQLVKGRVPIVLELKGRQDDDEGFADSVLEVLEHYDGPVALMSFSHHLLKDLKNLGCPCPVGLTAEGKRPEHIEPHPEAMALGLDFISYNVFHLPNTFVEQERANGMPVITWTVTSEAAMKHTYIYADQMTFEGFDPREGTGADE